MRYPRLFWASFLPVALVSKLIVTRWTPALAPQTVSRQEIQDAFLAGLADACRPEPAELIGYVLSVAVPFVLVFGIVVLLNLGRKLEYVEQHATLTGSVAVVSQAIILYYAYDAWSYESANSWTGQLNDVGVNQLTVLTCLSAWLAFAWLAPGTKRLLSDLWERLSKAQGIALLLAVGWTTAHLLECVFTDDNIRRASGTISYHLPFTMGEFAAVINGRFPLVDFYSQYQNLLAHLLRPVFHVVGLSVTTFTAAMSLLSGIGFLFLYRVLWRVSGSAWLGLILYVPMLSVSMAEAETAGVNPSNAFNYYAVGPIRYFGTFLGAYLALLYLSAPTRRRLLWVSAIAVLIGLNNLDFGVPAALGVLACTLLHPPRAGSESRWLRTLLAASIFVIGASLGFCAFLSFALVSTGTWPDLGILTEYQRTFAYLGFNMVPLPPNGLYRIMYITFICSLLYALFDGFSRSPEEFSPARRLSTGMLAYASIAGFGVGTYFVGRSHPAVIIAIYPAWAFALALLLHRILSDARAATMRRRSDSAVVHALPTAGMLTLCAGLIPLVIHIPHVDREIDRIEYHSGGLGSRAARLASFVSKYVTHGSQTVIVAVDAHQVALEAGVQNMYPFAHPGSVLLKSQLRPVLESIERLPPGDQYVFGAVWPEVAQFLVRSGFQQIDATGDFVAWFKHE